MKKIKKKLSYVLNFDQKKRGAEKRKYNFLINDTNSLSFSYLFHILPLIVKYRAHI